MPFCITVEAEALGANVNLGDIEIGPRVGEYVFNDIKELENIGKMVLNCGRIKEVLDSVEMLKNQGETVALIVEGPFTIISSLIDPMVFYKGIRNSKESIEKILKAIEDNIVDYALEGTKR